MKCLLLSAFLLSLAAPALADDQTLFLTKALTALQQQRNEAMDNMVNLEVKFATERDSLAAKLKTAEERITELEKKDAPK